MLLNKTLLISKNDIPFEEANLIIHPPTIKELALIGDDIFFLGCEYLTFSKNNILEEQDKIRLQDFSNFEVLMTMINDKRNIVIEKIKLSMNFILTLMFPDYKINFLPRSIMIFKTKDGQIQQHFIDQENFESFKNIVSEMFCLDFLKGDSSTKYNPKGPQAKALVKKFQERRKKLAKLKGQEDGDSSLFYQYISILSVGLQIDMNSLLNYTVYQLLDQFRRYQAKINFDMYTQARMAGAQNLEQVDNWMGKLHSNKR